MKSKLKIKIPVFLLFLGTLGVIGVLFCGFAATRFDELDNPQLGLFSIVILFFLMGYLTTYSFGKLFRELITIELDEQELRVFYLLTFRTKVIPWNNITSYHFSGIITGRYRTKMIEVLTIHIRGNERIDIVQYYHRNYNEVVKQIKEHTSNYIGYQPYKHGIFGRRYTNEYQK